MQKDVFQTDDDGLFLYTCAANELPLAPGVFNIPYGAYEDAPPVPSLGKWPRRAGDVWMMVDDHRTTPLWVVGSNAPYSLWADHEGPDGKVSYCGWGALPDWLTAVAPQTLSKENSGDN